MRISRKLGTLSPGKRYVWRKCVINYNIVSYPQYNFNLPIAAAMVTKQASPAYSTGRLCYTISQELGKFVLETPAPVRMDLTADRFLVDITGNTSSTATTGTQMWYIGAVDSSLAATQGLLTFMTIPYQCQGSPGAFITNVTSNTMDYPENGILGGYWYTLIQSP